MNRRDALVQVGGLLMWVTVSKTVTACGGGNNNTGDVVSTSTVVNSHTHRITLEAATLDAPPAGTSTETSTVDFSHSHTVDLTQVELQSIADGTSVTKTSSLESAHTHDFTFTRA